MIDATILLHKIRCAKEYNNTDLFTLQNQQKGAMVHSLTRLLTHVMTAKRDLKRVYYTSRDQDTKLDAKELVAATITLQKLLEDLISKRRTIRIAKKILEDRKAELNLQQWSIGFPRRSKDFLSKSQKLEQQHLRKYQQALLEYINGISIELAKWIEDIETLRGMPSPPKG
nr:MAG: hypothetical protein AM325_10175 [Candidatus Thorarchaeota archaeon SMTZ1-45]